MPASRRGWVAAAVIASLAVVLIVVYSRTGDATRAREIAGTIPRFATWVEGQGAAGAVAFVAGYAVATVLFFPGSLLTLAAGAVFGIAKGTLLVFIGATIGETAAFLIARHVARAPIERRLQRDQRFARLDRAIGQSGRRIVLLLRLSPVFPFNLLNYALGLTSVSLRDYLIGSIGILPGTLLYVYTGKVAGDVAAATAGVSPPRGPLYYSVLALGLVATAVVTIYIAKLAKGALEEGSELRG